MKIPRSIRLLVAICAISTTPRHAHSATIVVDQQNSGSPMAGFDFTSGSVGQSFTPSLAGIDTVVLQLSLSSLYAPAPATLRIDLFQGAGIGGTLLGSSALLTVNVTNTFSNSSPVEFDFTAPIILVPNNVYTFAVQPTAGGDNVLVDAVTPDSYARGIAFVGNTAFPTYDFLFSEGLRVTSLVPEPSIWAMLGLGGAGGLSLMVRQRRRRRLA